MSESNDIRVLAFGSAAAALGWTERVFPTGELRDLAALAERLERECPKLGEAHGRVRYAVNQKYAGAEVVLRGGDEVAIIPPVSGG
jgi:molybdopterin converting factor small subunit